MNESKDNVIKLKIAGMKSNEVYKDIARIHKKYRINIKGESIKEGTVCKLTIGNRTKRVSIRGLLEREDAIIQLDDYTRNELGVKRHDIVDITLKEEGVLGEFRWA